MKESHKKTGMLGLSLAALGVVFGDIGTSPLYAINEIFHHAGGGRDEAFVLGAISTVFWALTLIVAIKYVIFVLRADYQGEGGVFALFGQLHAHRSRRAIAVLTTLLVLAAGLLFGDGLITPAISVLSAVEGLKVAFPSLAELVVPITITILTGLFLIQSKGTSVIGKLFGPIISVWFLAIGLLGANQLARYPQVLEALNPIYIIDFLASTPLHELLLVLGSVMLVVTGGEALFADMGHFGRRPIRISWFAVVYPMLTLSYLGQGAFLLSGQEIQGDNIFFSMIPQLLLLPMILLATMATIIASQALISGVFSLASQGIALGYLPRLKTINTSSEHSGQIYIPTINWLLYIGCIVLVVTFGSSSKLAAAYGLAVAIDMVLTSLCMMVLARLKWHWSYVSAIGLFGLFLTVELLFLTANSLKLFQGGYVPLEIALTGFVIMSTWRWGRAHITNAYSSHERLTMAEILQRKQTAQHNFPRSVLVLTAKDAHRLEDLAPFQLNMFVDRYHLLPKHLITLTVKTHQLPYVSAKKRYTVTVFQNNRSKDQSMIAVTVHYGFMEAPDLKRVVRWIARNEELTPNDDMRDWIIFVGKERLILDKAAAQVHRWRYALFRILARNAEPTFSAYGLGEDSRISMELVPVTIRR